MKKSTVLLILLSLFYGTYAQKYDTQKLESIAEIWSECYLFHPAIVRSENNINWEKQLVDFLPEIADENSTEDLVTHINSGLLSVLNDPLTTVQTTKEQKQSETSQLTGADIFDYLKFMADDLSDLSILQRFDSDISVRNSIKPLVIDCRINSEIQADEHTYTPFHYFASMLISKEIPLSQTVTREHFGWDELNDWWFYEQRWKIMQDDRQQFKNGKLMPFTAYMMDIQQYLPDFNPGNLNPIERPVYFVVNKNFLSLYYPVLHSLQIHRDNTFIIFENSGKILAGNKKVKKYNYDEFEFVLNTAFYINNGSSAIYFDMIEPLITQEKLSRHIQSEPKNKTAFNSFSLNIAPQKYESTGDVLSTEEKILGIIKIWAVVKYFYPYPENCSIDWNNSLGMYLEAAQETMSDKEFYKLVLGMMATLNDSHVFTFHQSILDFSEIFVAPVQFEWIDDKVLITGFDNTLVKGISIGDEIVAIDNLTIDSILKNEAKTISHGNRQGLLATVINPGYFIGAEGSTIRFDIIHNGRKKAIEVPRTVYVFQFIASADQREAHKILDNNIGYINLTAFQDARELENTLVSMQNTRSLILDLRNSYPTDDFSRFLQMLCPATCTIRQSSVPVISATGEKVWQSEISVVNPDPSFSYNKPVIVLIDKTMISRPEDIAIALKAFPNVRFVGEQTQGADGEIAKIFLPGGGETTFTGQIINFGNGYRFQNTGITPDIEVKRSAEGIRSQKDEILEKAVEILMSE